MSRFVQIPESTFNDLQTEAGVLLKQFDPANPTFENSDIICATTGGISATCVPTYSDYGEDVDNAPVKVKELMHLDGWETTLDFTALTFNPGVIRFALGAADVNAENGSIIPRRNLKQDDFSDVWWVGDLSDGGMVAVHLINALSTSGFSLQTTKSGKGQLSVTLAGHVSIEEQDRVPMEFFHAKGEQEDSGGGEDDGV